MQTEGLFVVIGKWEPTSCEQLYPNGYVNRHWMGSVFEYTNCAEGNPVARTRLS